MSELPRGFERIQECEAAIVRIRASLRSGASDDETVGADWEFIRQAVQPRFVSYARRLRWMGGQVFEEALLAMNDRLFDNVWSLTFPSLETGLGSYLHHMPQRILQETARKYRPNGVSELIEHLDETVGEDGVQRHELVEDPRAEAAFDALADRQDVREAIERLPALEREVVTLRLQDVDNGTIARRLELSPATATRIWQRAAEMLRQALNPPEE
jgi:RNA polymerase sigma factor (sigma-70 family)